MKLFAKRGKWRLCEILPTSVEEMAKMPVVVGVPTFYADYGVGRRMFYPEPAYGIEIEEVEE